jgi:hypothetical protein
MGQRVSTTVTTTPARAVLALLMATAMFVWIGAGVAHAQDNTYCPTGVATTYDGPTNGSWGTNGDTTNWSNGLPDLNCDAVIPAGDTVTLTTTPGQEEASTDAGGSAEGLTIGAGATLIVEGVSSQGEQGNVSNTTTLTFGAQGLTIATGASLDLKATDNSSPFTGNAAGETTGGNAQVIPDGSPTASITNAGTINASTSSANSKYKQGIGWNGTLANTGAFNVSSGALTVQGQNYPMTLSNTSRVSIGSAASLTMFAGDGSALTNDGTFANQGTTSLQGSMHWVQSGGAETGNPVQLTNGETLEDSAGAGAFEVTNCSSDALTGTIPAGQTVSVLGCTNGGATLFLGAGNNPPPVVNDGTLDLDAPTNNGADAIVAGTELDNHGTMNATVADGTAPAPSNDQLLVPLVNEPGATVNLTGGELAQSAGTASSNRGTVNIGPRAVWLVQGGSFTNAGTVAPQIASATNLGHFNLTVGSKFTAGGTVAPTLAPGYAPAAGTEFQFITYNGGSATGSFGSVTGGFSADYSQESATTPYVGLIYKRSARPTPPAPKVGKVSGGTRKLTVALSCPSHAKRCASYTASATVTEHLKGKKVVAVAAAAQKSRSSRKVLVVGSAGGTLKPGKSATVTLKLNRTGTALLKKFHKLKVVVAVRSGGKVIAKKTVTITEPKR